MATTHLQCERKYILIQPERNIANWFHEYDNRFEMNRWQFGTNQVNMWQIRDGIHAMKNCGWSENSDALSMLVRFFLIEWNGDTLY